MWLALAAIGAASSAAYADLANDVAHARGLAFKRAVPIEMLDADAFAARVAVAASSSPWRVEQAAPSLDAVFDGTEVIAKLDASESSIAAALDRALIEQHFELATSDPDARRARDLLETGDAEALAIDLALARAGKPTPWDDPELVAQLVEGNVALAYVARLRRRGWREVDAAFRKPPVATAELLHPGTRIVPVAIAGEAPADWTLADTDVWGELGVRSFLVAHGVAEVVAAEVAAGWLGDRAITCTRGSRSFGLWRSEWSSEADAERARAAIERALGDAVLGVQIDATRWIGLDGSVAFVERRGTGVVAAIGVPLYETLDAWELLKRTDTARAR